MRFFFLTHLCCSCIALLRVCNLLSLKGGERLQTRANYSPTKSLVPPTRFQNLNPDPTPNPNQYSGRYKRFSGKIIGTRLQTQVKAITLKLAIEIKLDELVS